MYEMFTFLNDSFFRLNGWKTVGNIIYCTCCRPGVVPNLKLRYLVLSVMFSFNNFPFYSVYENCNQNIKENICNTWCIVPEHRINFCNVAVFKILGGCISVPD
jgi:hypothetical protein